MKRSNSVAWRTCWLVTMAGVAIVSSSVRAGPASQKQAPATAITILDQNGRPVPNVSPSATSQIVDVTVAPGGALVFSPDTVNISVGDTVRWTWDSSFHSVSSGTSCAIDSQFCSPDDMNCTLGTLSNAGAVYQHTFGQAGSYSYFCVVHCSRGMTGTINVAPSCAPPPANMVAWWPGDGNARDIQGGHNGSLQGGATFGPGEVQQAFTFNGTDGEVVLPNSSSAPLLNFGPTDSFTVDAWLKPDPSVLGTQRVAVSLAYVCSPEEIGLILLIDGRIDFAIRDNLVNSVDAVSPSSILDANWHHVTGVRDVGTDTVKLYLDGVAVTSLTDTTTGTFTRADGQNRIGSISVACPTDRYFWKGQIDEVEVFRRALSQSEIQAIVNAGAAGKCKAPQVTGAFSRKAHGGAGTFDIDLMPNGTPGIECRNGVSGVYQMIVQFSNPVTVAGATLLSGSGSVSGFSVAGATVTVDLSDVTNVQTIVVKLTGVNDGTLSGDVPVAMSVLVGDTNGNGSVSASDIGQTKAQSGQTTTGSNFRTDVNASGAISAADIGLVKSKSGTSLPP